jgi:hypothetical protein
MENINELLKLAGVAITESRHAKPDYIDLDKDGNRKESMKKAAKDKEAHQSINSNIKETVQEEGDYRSPDLKRRDFIKKAGAVAAGAAGIGGLASLGSPEDLPEFEEMRNEISRVKQADPELASRMERIQRLIVDQWSVDKGFNQRLYDQFQELNAMSKDIAFRRFMEPPREIKEERQLDECGMGDGAMSPMGSMAQEMEKSQGRLSVSSNFDSDTGRKSLTVTAEGDQAEELAELIKLSGMLHGGEKHSQEVYEAYANEPNPKMMTLDQMLNNGDDLHKTKKSYPKAQDGDNPRAVKKESTVKEALEQRLWAEFQREKAR